jgi:hypothetical protein
MMLDGLDADGDRGAPAPLRRQRQARAQRAARHVARPARLPGADQRPATRCCALDDCDHAFAKASDRKTSLLLYRVVCVDEDTMLWTMSDIGNLRTVLNALARTFRC